MVEKLKFENFKGFQKIELSELKPITLISGKNNTGKSSILEGMFLYFDHIAPDSFSKINYFRGTIFPNGSLGMWESAFYQMDTKQTMRIFIETDGIPSCLEYVRDDSFIPPNDINMTPEMMNQIISSAKSSYTLKFQYQKESYSEDGHFIASSANIIRNITTNLENNQIELMPNTYFINSAIMNNNSSIIAEWFGRLEVKGKKQQILDTLALIEPEICDLSTIASNSQVQLYAKIGQQMLPLRLAGDGLNKLLYIVLLITANPHSILLIDEIETGFHYSMFSKLWETIA
ncbi:MAG: ATP-binding protein, partial [Odoribacter sp.]|nr:ATP-binding protein [Odoribacter sp.]